MKKKFIAIIFLTVITAGALFGCGNALTADEFEWRLQTAHTFDAQTQTLTIIARDEKWAAENTAAPVVDVALVAKDGVITITDNGAKRAYTGTYEKIQSGNKGETVYKLTVGRLSGQGTVAYTQYDDGTKQPTFPVALIDGNIQYSLFFYAK